MATDYRPCPKCGGRHIGLRPSEPDNYYTNWYMVCENCGHRGPEHREWFMAEDLWDEAAEKEENHGESKLV